MARIIKPITMVAYNTNAIPNAYTAMNAGGIPRSCFALRLMNYSNISVNISFDGVNAHDIIRTNTDKDYPGIYALQETGITGAWQKGTTVYVSAPAVGAGFIYLCGYYLKN
jgi:hypothetical protein